MEVDSGVGLGLVFPSVAVAAGEEVGAFLFLDVDGCDYDLIDPMVPSA